MINNLLIQIFKDYIGGAFLVHCFDYAILWNKTDDFIKFIDVLISNGNNEIFKKWK